MAGKDCREGLPVPLMTCPTWVACLRDVLVRVVPGVFMGVERLLMCVMCQMTGAQVYSVVHWLFGCSLVGLLVVLFVPLFLSFLAMPGLCYFLSLALPVWQHRCYMEKGLPLHKEGRSTTGPIISTINQVFRLLAPLTCTDQMLDSTAKSNH